ncbi:FMN-binding protein [Glaciihabitans arcticus]|uniref:FMN-binding protein n=1 Tax=Glaciihabitans arcticus TaxID=2668039 RepID=A0A4V2JF21_9MICO|nr:FMN-binding protein [Glaciihabitans arcticus]TBN57739.1 FMN-binding protein [Glaciihabitans arcticus]
MKTSTKKTTFAVLAAVSLLGTVTGCAAAATPTDTGSDAGTDTGSASDAPYADGTYEASGDYQSPNGIETVDVTITLADDTVTDVQVVGHGQAPESREYQGQFIDGIAAEVVGKDIDEISVDRVAGSSLTSGGFMKALDAIKADALA